MVPMLASNITLSIPVILISFKPSTSHRTQQLVPGLLLPTPTTLKSWKA